MNMILDKKIGVYIEINKQNEIIKVFSDVFEQPSPSSIKIDEGFGDKYAHAQSQYFEKDIIDIMGNKAFKFDKENKKIIDNLIIK